MKHNKVNLTLLDPLKRVGRLLIRPVDGGCHLVIMDLRSGFRGRVDCGTGSSDHNGKSRAGICVEIRPTAGGRADKRYVELEWDDKPSEQFIESFERWSKGTLMLVLAPLASWSSLNVEDWASIKDLS